MAEERDEPAALSPQGVDTLEFWLAGRRCNQPGQPVGTGVDVLIRFLAGLAGAEEYEATLLAVTQDAVARERLRATLTCLERLQQSPWADVATTARTEGLPGEVAREWLSITAGQLAAIGEAREYSSQRPWRQIRQEARLGVIRAQGVCTALASLGEQIRRSLALGQLAPARGGGDWASTADDPVNRAGLVAARAEVSPGGAVRLEFSSSSQPSTGERTVSLGSGVCGEGWPLLVEGPGAAPGVVELPELGDLLGMPEGELPRGMVDEDVGGEVAQSSRVPEWALLASVEGPGKSQGEVPSAAVLVQGTPHWKDQRFYVEIALPPETRRPFAGQLLVLDVAVSTRCAQRVGSWPVDSWGDGYSSLSCFCPGAPDRALPHASLLRASMVPGDSPV